MPRRHIRRTDFETRVRNMLEASEGLPAMAGRSRIGAGLLASGGGLLPSAYEPDDEAVETTGAAKLLVLTATADSIAPGGDYVTLATIVDQRGFEGVAQPAGGYWTHPATGVYVLAYEHDWDTYQGGGTIEVELDGAVARTITTGTAGQTAFDVVAYYAELGQVGRIKVTHSDAAAQTCSAMMQVAITDPTDAEQPVNWVMATSADVYDLTWDGTSWWTTEGFAGETVSQRDTGWVQTSSFEATAVSTAATPSSRAVRGITFDGTNLWMVGESNIDVARYSTAGVLVSEFDPAWGDTGLVGVAFDGTDLWIVGNSTDQLRRYSTAGVLLQTVGLPSTNNHAGCAFYNGRIYTIDSTANTLVVYRIATNTFDPVIDVSEATIDATGVWIAADGTLYVSKDGAGVWRRNTVV